MGEILIQVWLYITRISLTLRYKDLFPRKIETYTRFNITHIVMHFTTQNELESSSGQAVQHYEIKLASDFSFLHQ